MKIHHQAATWGIVMHDENYGVVVVLQEIRQPTGDIMYVPQRPHGFIKHETTVIFDGDVEVAPEIVEAILGK
jgi:hypothetical protein